MTINATSTPLSSSTYPSIIRAVFAFLSLASITTQVQALADTDINENSVTITSQQTNIRSTNTITQPNSIETQTRQLGDDNFFDDDYCGHHNALQIPTEQFQIEITPTTQEPTEQASYELLRSLQTLTEESLLEKQFYISETGEVTESEEEADVTMEVYSIRILNVRDVIFHAEPGPDAFTQIRVSGMLIFFDFPESDRCGSSRKQRSLMYASDLDNESKLALRKSVMTTVQSNLNTESSSNAKKLQTIYDLKGISGTAGDALSLDDVQWTWSSQGYTLAPSPSPPEYGNNGSEDDDGEGGGNGNENNPVQQNIDPVVIEPNEDGKEKGSLLVTISAGVSVFSIIVYFLVSRHRQKRRLKFESPHYHEDMPSEVDVINDLYRSNSNAGATRELPGLEVIPVPDSKFASFLRRFSPTASKNKGFQSHIITQAMGRGSDQEMEQIDDGAFPTISNNKVQMMQPPRTATPSIGDGSRTLLSCPDIQGAEIAISSGQSDDGVSSLGGSEKGIGAHNVSTIQLLNMYEPDPSREPSFLPSQYRLPSVETELIQRQDSLSYSDSSASGSISIPATMLLESQSASEPESDNEEDDILQFSDSDSGIGDLLDEAYGAENVNGPSLDDISAVSPTSTEGINIDFQPGDDKSLPSVV